MADTITILKGLQFTKPVTADVYTIDGDAVSPVGSYKIPIDCMAIKGLMVVFNGAYDPDGGRYHCRVKYGLTTKIAGLTKTEGQLMEWTTVTPPAVTATSELDVTTAYFCELFVDVCMSSTTANTTGIEIIVMIRTEVGVDEWIPLSGGKFVGPTGTAVKSDFASETAAGQTVLNVTNPVTGRLDHLGKTIFLEDTITIAQCEIAFLVAQSGD